VIYSYSKLKAFETCPLKFRYRYLDRITPDLETIEAFTGKRVHEVLEALFRSLAADPRPPDLGEVLALYDEAWERAWHGQVEVIKPGYTPADYRRLGSRCLATFYRGNWPFSFDHTLGLETEIEFELEQELKIKHENESPARPRVVGVLDRVASGAGGELHVHDYKTSTYLPRQQEILGDLQLAIYQLGAAKRWPGAPAVKLIWHFLAFGRRVTVRLGQTGLSERQALLGRRIGNIARAVVDRRLPPRVSPLCRWCGYRRLCPAYGESGAWGPSLSWPPRAEAAALAGNPPLPDLPGIAAAKALSTLPPIPPIPAALGVATPPVLTALPAPRTPRASLRLRPIRRRWRKRVATDLTQLQLFDSI
jgi:putative RecB family exonuclease